MIVTWKAFLHPIMINNAKITKNLVLHANMAFHRHNIWSSFLKSILTIFQKQKSIGFRLLVITLWLMGLTCFYFVLELNQQSSLSFHLTYFHLTNFEWVKMKFFFWIFFHIFSTQFSYMISRASTFHNAKKLSQEVAKNFSFDFKC